MPPPALIDVFVDHRSEFVSGFGVTVRLVVISFAIAMVVGTLVAALRIAPSPWLQRLGGIFDIHPLALEDDDLAKALLMKQEIFAYP